MRCLTCNFDVENGQEFCPNCGCSCLGTAETATLQRAGSLSPGTVLASRYRIEDTGVNGRARFYCGTCLVTGTRVLIEEASLPVDHSQEDRRCLPEPTQNVADEQRASGDEATDYTPQPAVSLAERHDLLASLDNTRFVRVYDYLVCGGREYLVMEIPEGMSLTELAAAEGVSADEAVDIAIELCRAVSEIHRRGYLHLNLEPGSIFVSNGKVKLFDLGQAMKKGQIRRYFLTTDCFSAPELMLSEPSVVDERADIYSIGAVALWLLSREKVGLLGIPSSKVVSLVSSPWLGRILLRCLAKDVNSRYRTVDELLCELEAFRAFEKQEVHYHCAALSDVGLVRQNNEDACFCLDLTRCVGSQIESYGIYVVADGMGGHEGGEVASRLAVEKVWSSIMIALNREGTAGSPCDIVKEAIALANDEVYALSRGSRRLSSMGTTITVGFRVNNSLYLGHVGDSRCYLIRGGEIIRLTRDHSVVGGLLELGIITLEQARQHPDRGKIYRCLGATAEVTVDTLEATGHGEKLELREGDRLVFCTDGLTNEISDKEILECVTGATGPKTACEALVRLANAKGGSDNITVIVVDAGVRGGSDI